MHLNSKKSLESPKVERKALGQIPVHRPSFPFRNPPLEFHTVNRFERSGAFVRVLVSATAIR